ncbi:MAG: FtsX-like permease family protein [Caloramator sp.]|nr:FtsX-like permease family protein [Caloramator sp.]
MDKENGVIVIEKNTFDNKKTNGCYLGKAANLKVGDVLPIEVNNELNKNSINTTFDEGIKNIKVVGIVEKSIFLDSGYNMLKIITSKKVAEKLLKTNIKPQNVMIVLKDINMQKDAQREIEKVIQQNKNLYIINIIDELKNFKSVILMLKILLYGFVVVVSLIGSVNIINTLTTNIIVRRREFASLKSVGQTPRGLKKMVILEGMIYGISGQFWGTLLGVLLSYFLFTKMTMTIAQTFFIPYRAILVSFIIVLLISFISIQLPLKRLERENLIEVVRED